MQNNTNELSHHGIKGQRWGFRRYQNADGSLTPAGKKRAAKMKEEYTALTGKRLVRQAANKKVKVSSKNDAEETKSVKDMTDAELREKTNRMNLENNYQNALKTMNELNPKQVSKGKAFVKKAMTEVLEPAISDVTKQLVKSYMVKTVNEAFKLDDELKVYTNNKKKN